MTPLGKLFRTTAFKISLAYLVIFAIGAGLVLSRVGWHVKELIDEQIKQTIDTDITGLAEQYAQGGIRQLTSVIERRVKQPGAGLYLVTTYAGEPIAGNITSLPAGVLSQAGTVETNYQRPGETALHRAFARIFILPDGFRLLVGHDIEEEESLRQILSGALVASLVWLTIIGTLGGLIVARRVLTRVDSINAGARRIVAGDLSGRLPVTGSGDELDRLVLNLNHMLDRIGELMAGVKDVSDNIAHDLRTPLTRLRNGAEQALRSASSVEENRLALEKVIEESDTMIRIFDALLMIARAEAGTTFEGMVAFDAAPVVQDVCELYEPVAEDRGREARSLCRAGAFHRRQPRADRSGARQSHRQCTEIWHPDPWLHGRTRQRAGNHRHRRAARHDDRTLRRRPRAGDSACRPQAGARSFRAAGKFPLAAGLRPRPVARRGCRAAAQWHAARRGS